ncbi:hypothetical protein RUM43_002119 [Polyplax serrata]|uniref:Uncharacterized protein n=1 Tax=Polyplax serrata TaxID=468196 RepID=A0AAN8PDD6_POLSC
MSRQESGSKTGTRKSVPMTTMDVLEKIQKCQKEITTFRSKCDRDINEIEKKYLKTVKPYIKDRNFLILSVPQFWPTVLLHHPLFGSIFEPGEKDVIKYLASVDVEDDVINPDLFKIHFLFNQNPYFENRVLVKHFTEEGSTNTLIKWRTSQVFPQVTKHEIWEHDELGMEQKGFFRWFTDPKEEFCDPIADILRAQLWYDPLEYYFYENRGDQNVESTNSVGPKASTQSAG